VKYVHPHIHGRRVQSIDEFEYLKSLGINPNISREGFGVEMDEKPCYYIIFTLGLL